NLQIPAVLDFLRSLPAFLSPHTIIPHSLSFFDRLQERTRCVRSFSFAGGFSSILCGNCVIISPKGFSLFAFSFHAGGILSLWK
ncbi:hypothetical protein, partial [Allofournierella massiliensis]